MAGIKRAFRVSSTVWLNMANAPESPGPGLRQNGRSFLRLVNILIIQQVVPVSSGRFVRLTRLAVPLSKGATIPRGEPP
ncbi:hypothetical protein [Roseovarius halotolerans]|uniref:hypothetical protein n=1 Tax=Roseovarius halotolerans TaxID=505353 RepID=UPI00111C3810|nr:hypothetical protein [Roseovarius halotolerans]